MLSAWENIYCCSFARKMKVLLCGLPELCFSAELSFQACLSHPSQWEHARECRGRGSWGRDERARGRAGRTRSLQQTAKLLFNEGSSITLSLYSICGSWFGYYRALLFPNFKVHVFIKASEIVFTLQLWFLPIVLYHPCEEAELCSLLWAQKSELQLVPHSPPGWAEEPRALVLITTLLSGPL